MDALPVPPIHACQMSSIQGSSQTSHAIYGHNEGPDERQLPGLKRAAITLLAGAVHQLFNKLAM